MSALADFLLAAPAERSARRSAATVATAPARGVAVLAGAGDALAAGASAALVLAQRADAGGGLVCVGDETAPALVRRVPPTRAARRLAAALSTRGHEVVATGRLAVVSLVGPAEQAAVEAARAMAAAGDAPAVLALGGAREEAFDALLRERELVLVALRAGEERDALAALAVAGAEALGVRALACRLGRAPAARALALAGLAPLTPVRATLLDALAAPA